MCYGWGTKREALFLFDTSGSMGMASNYAGASMTLPFQEVMNGIATDPAILDAFEAAKALGTIDAALDADDYRYGLAEPGQCRCPMLAAGEYYNSAGSVSGDVAQWTAMRLRTGDDTYATIAPLVDWPAGIIRSESGEVPGWKIGTEGPVAAMRAAAYLWDREEGVHILPPEYGGEPLEGRPTQGGRPLLNGDGTGAGVGAAWHAEDDEATPPRLLVMVGDQFGEEALDFEETVEILRAKRIRVVCFFCDTPAKSGDGYMQALCDRTRGVLVYLTSDMVPHPHAYLPSERHPIDPHFPADDPVRRFPFEFGDPADGGPYDNRWMLWQYPGWFEAVMPFVVRAIDFLRGFDELAYDEPPPAWEPDEEGGEE